MTTNPTTQHLHRGLKLYTQGSLHEALWEFLEGLTDDPQNSLGHYLCGLTFQALGQENEARAEWENVLCIAQAQTAAPGEETHWAQQMTQTALHMFQVRPEDSPQRTDVRGASHV